MHRWTFRSVSWSLSPDPRGRVLQVNVDLFDNRVAAVDLVRCNGAHHFGVGGGEEGVEPPGVDQRVLPVLSAGVQVRDGAHDERPGTFSLRFLEENAVKVISVTSARETQVPLASSKTASGTRGGPHRL